MTPAPGGRMMTVHHLATVWGVSPMTVYRLIREKELRARRIGRSLRISERDAAEYWQNADTTAEL